VPTLAKQHWLNAYLYDALGIEAFDNVPSIGAGVANTTIQAYYPLAVNIKIYAVVVIYSAIAGSDAVNIVYGTAAEGAVPTGSNDPQAVSGTPVFSADQALSAAANTPTIFIPTNPDVVYPAGGLLTLRAVTQATTGSISNLKVQFVYRIIDLAPFRPINLATAP
jgi:hypothetical protein